MMPVILLLTDLLSLCLAAWLAITLRFAEAGAASQVYTAVFFSNIPLYLALHAAFFYAFKLYHRVWKYAGIKEMMCIAGANACGMLSYALLYRATGGLLAHSNAPLPNSLLLLAFFLNISLLAASRLFVRWSAYQVEKGDKENDTVYKIMNGVPVLGTRADIPRITEKENIREIIIAIPSMEIRELSELGEICSSAVPDVTVKILPSFFTSMDSAKVNYNDLRPLQIEDLLNRDPVRLDMETFGKYLQDKVVGLFYHGWTFDRRHNFANASRNSTTP